MSHSCASLSSASSSPLLVLTPRPGPQPHQLPLRKPSAFRGQIPPRAQKAVAEKKGKAQHGQEDGGGGQHHSNQACRECPAWASTLSTLRCYRHTPGLWPHQGQGNYKVVGRALPREGGLLDDTLNWLLLDCTVVAVQDTEEVADEVAITTLFASRKASWKLYKHFCLVALFFSLLSDTAGASSLGGGGRASGLGSDSAGPSMSPPSEKNGRVKSPKKYVADTYGTSADRTPNTGAATEARVTRGDARQRAFIQEKNVLSTYYVPIPVLGAFQK